MQQLIGWLLLIASIAGHTEWWVMVVNRSHALRISSTRLRKFRTLHDVAVLFFPVVLLWLTGTGPKSLLFGGRFSEQSVLLQRLLVVTIAGCVPLLLGMYRWHWIRRPQFKYNHSATRHNVLRHASTEDERASIRGPRRHPSQLWPLNEIFHLEVNTKAVRVIQTVRSGKATRKPFRLAHLSDLHFIGCPGPGYYRFLVNRVIDLQPDLILFTGDLIDEMALLPEAIDILRKYWKGPVGAYPESGYFKMPDWTFVDIIPPDELVERSRAWKKKGVTAFGGCCGLGPEHITALHKAFT